jgi:hypothetical protein
LGFSETPKVWAARKSAPPRRPLSPYAIVPILAPERNSACIGEGEWRGRETIKQCLLAIPKQEEPAPSPDAAPLRPAGGRHNITNIVLKIEGDRAWGRAYWFHMGNRNPERSAVLNSYGHYDDELVKVNGEWLFSRRRIYNEQEARWAWQGGNPCW